MRTRRFDTFGESLRDVRRSVHAAVVPDTSNVEWVVADGRFAGFLVAAPTGREYVAAPRAYGHRETLRAAGFRAVA
ncbi:hypothetical protein WJ86_07405 [Burkholderia multivorans]|nr:hypothetical protein WJ86_07405 [Burkholderia multivorans]